MVRGSPAPRTRRHLQQRHLPDPHRHSTPPHGHPAHPRHRPDAPGRPAQHRRRNGSLPVTPSDDSHIASVLIGDDVTCTAAAARLLDRYGIYVQAINAPSVRPGEEILRLAPSAVHTPTDVEDLATALHEVWHAIVVPLHPST
ncbi:aminotransferase class I/II-fold pyridoxal phosphate-dependent enzyme [Streptomyces sp. MspMP-M5]|uniref:aminotransferase class I/II-fold pyridoxal phosphate-dependent enzyme n=1 Tax=unclassified Streptomyces TaxID=2593676 RepID=UPI001319C516|nr:aminotransferase class I/II-fold pyridoxal phosphate-dependent enzyme [Streptomyces sp. MspMP-M5]MYT32307.1 aminotransferase class I/II-fold pyridoxal phosphate-dependent enzyme [Streptomyces sp. SID8354]